MLTTTRHPWRGQIVRARGRHRLVKPYKRRVALVATGSVALIAGGILAPLAPASADSCFETPDTGWVCTPDPNPSVSLTVSTVAVVDELDAPDDATPIDTLPDPNAPVPTPDVSVETDTTIPDATSTSCKSWGTATWENPASDATCPPLHWLNGYYYVNDQTGSAWPVNTYTTYWNGVPGLSVGYGCPSSYHCVKVVEGHYGTVNPKTGKRMWLGLTTFHYYAGTHTFASMTIQFNDSWRISAAEHSQAVCHEMGHASGLGHETQNNSCMWYRADGTHTVASGNDFNQLQYHTY